MPEIKHQFTGGKMNKDLDERLVPNGEYRDAMNVQVSTSDGSNVGAIQNVLGNSIISGQDFITTDAVCVGSIADEKNNKLYYFIADFYAIIIEYDTIKKTVIPIIVDTTVGADVLSFDAQHAITGINIIDELLLWTDNKSEPKKINIPRCKAGTDPSGIVHTKLMVGGNYDENLVYVNGINEGLIKESHIAVIKKGPSKAPKTIPESAKISGYVKGSMELVGVGNVNYFYPIGNDGGEVEQGHETWIGLQNIDRVQVPNGGLSVGTSPNLVVGDVIRVYNGKAVPQDGEKPIARLLIKQIEPGQFYYSQAQNNYEEVSGHPTYGAIIAYSHQVAYKVSVSTLISHDFTSGYYFELEQEEHSIFKGKFPRFSTRYKYEDNEYSPVGPYSEVVFIPGKFDYHPTEAYNKGMVNNLKQLILQDFVSTDIPKDVVGIDLLYKNEFSPNVYVIKSVDKNDEVWNNGYTNPLKPKGSYIITTDNVYAQVPSNQLIRPWDNVPKKALAQEVTGNRVVYGNYVQGYNLENELGQKITPKLTASIDNRFDSSYSTSKTRKSLKSQRTYNFGILYGDKYGRETPVFTNDKANELITKSSSASSSSIAINIESSHPSWAEYYKILVKETSSEYYNVAMGRAYDAEDGNVWISFPSIDRNKIDEDTYLVLKKGHEQDNFILDEARYKVVAIENEAPDYIKTRYNPIAEPNMDVHGYLLTGAKQTALEGDPRVVEFPSPVQPPFPGQSSFTIRHYTWSDPYDVDTFRFGLPDMVKAWEDRKNTDIYVSFSNKYREEGDTTSWVDVPIRMTKKYRVMDIVKLEPSGTFTNGVDIPDLYFVRLNQSISMEDAFITDNFTDVFQNGGQLKPHFYRKEIENLPEFDGRFFVKLIEDEVLANNIPRIAAPTSQGWNVDAAISELYYLSDSSCDSNEFLIDGGLVGTTGENASVTPANWRVNLGGPVNDYNGTYSRWFIDATAYAGSQPNGSADVRDFEAVQDGVALSDTTSAVNYKIVKDADGDRLADLEDYSIVYLDMATDTLGQDEDETWGDGRSLGARFLHGAHTGSYTQGDLGDVTTNAHANDFGDGPNNYLHLSYGGIAPQAVGAGLGSLNPNTAGAWNKSWWDHYNYDRFWDNNLVPSMNADIAQFAQSQNHVIEKLTYGSLFRLKGDPNVYKITQVTKRRLYNYMGANRIAEGLKWYANSADDPGASSDMNSLNADDYVYTYNINLAIANGIDYSSAFTRTGVNEQVKTMMKPDNARISYLIQYQVLNGQKNHDLDGASSTGTPIHSNDHQAFDLGGSIINSTTHGGLEFVSTFTTTEKNILPSNPAIFETEPKEDVDLDIYYEATGKKPISTTQENILNLVEIGAIITVTPTTIVGGVMDGTFVTGVQNTAVGVWKIVLSNKVSLEELGFINGVSTSDNSVRIKFHNDDGSFVVAKLTPFTYTGGGNQPANIQDSGLESNQSFASIPTSVQTIYVEFIDNTFGLGWWNCWSFGNGVESNRIGDTYNKPFIANGVKASTTVLEDYKEEQRKHGLIYSGIYNSTSGVNSLNQFIAAEKITKDLNPTYGSIQKLHSRSTADGDLIALCEDRVIRILADKDAIFNADGNPQLIATENVLGQAIPYSGEYGISKDPQSFASESYRLYFSDKTRGAIIRLSKDGLTAISDHGMKDWFKDNLKLSNKLIGSYDDKKDEYNVTLKNIGEKTYTSTNTSIPTPFTFSGYGDIITAADTIIISAMSGVEAGDLVTVNSFYLSLAVGTVVVGTNVVGNTMTVALDNLVVQSPDYAYPPSFPWQSNFTFTGTRVTIKTTTVQDPVDTLPSKTVTFKEDTKGWVSFKSFTPENAISCANEYYTFKSGKLWQHHVKGLVGSPTPMNTFYDIHTSSSLTALLNDMPGIVKSFKTINYTGSDSKTIKPSAETYLYPGGDISSDGEYYNFNNNAGWHVVSIETNKQKGSINEFIEKEGKWFNYISGEAIVSEPGGLTVSGLDLGDFSFQGIGIPTGISQPIVIGCTDSTQQNYISWANTESDPSTCIAYAFGCLDLAAANYDATANYDDGSCYYPGCTDPLAMNYDSNATTDDGSCNTPYFGCTDPSACNYDINATYDNNTCMVPDGCTDPTAGNYNFTALCDDGSCCVAGCTDPLATSTYDPLATCASSGCVYCDNPTAPNYNIGFPCNTCSPVTSISVNMSSRTTTTIELFFPELTMATSYTLVIQEALTAIETTLSIFSNTLGMTGWGTGTITITVGAITALTDTTEYNFSIVTDCSQLPANGVSTASPITSATATTLTPTVQGCLDPLACNYNALANFDPAISVCEYLTCAGCMNSSYEEYGVATNGLFPTISDPFQCLTLTSSITGCTDPTALNYNSNFIYDCNGEFGNPNNSNWDSCCQDVADYTYVPDDNFENYLEVNGMGDTVMNPDPNLALPYGNYPNYVLNSYIDAVTSLNLQGESISDLTGVEGFTALQTITISENPQANNGNFVSLQLLTDLVNPEDLTTYTNLTEIKAKANNYTILGSDDLIFPDLETLNVGGNYGTTDALNTIDLGNLPSLKKIYVQWTSITSLDTSSNTALNHLQCNNTSITSLDVSSNTALSHMNVMDASLNTITFDNTGGNSNVKFLKCYNNNLSTIDLTGLERLQHLKIQNNNLTTLTTPASNNVGSYQLELIDCSNNALTHIDASAHNSLLKHFNANNNGDLASIYFGDNDLDQIISMQLNNVGVFSVITGADTLEIGTQDNAWLATYGGVQNNQFLFTGKDINGVSTLPSTWSTNITLLFNDA